MEDLIIRSEKPGDYAEIAELQYLAFKNDSHIVETVLIDVLRHRREFDPELSLVAIKDKQLIGHILFNPFTLYFNDRKVSGVNLAPLSVHPDHQKKGVGSKLIEKGHELVKERGYDISFLWGHPEYYPRFGYIKKAFADGGIKINLNDIPTINDEIETGMPRKEDVPFLQKIWKDNFSGAGLAIFPGKSILDWVSYTSTVKTLMVKIDDENVGYVRYKPGNENKPVMLLAKDEVSLIKIVSYLKEMIADSQEEFVLPLHLESYIAKRIKDKVSYKPALRTVDPFMIKKYNNEMSFLNFTELEKLGLFILPPHFDIG